MNWFKYIILYSVMIQLFNYSMAQFEEMIIPSDLKQQTIITEPQTLRKGYFRAGIGATFIFADRFFDDEGNKSYILGTNVLGKRWDYNLYLSYGITDRFQADMYVPYTNQEDLISFRILSPLIDYDTIITNKSFARGFSDMDFGLRYLLLQEDEIKPSLSLGVYLKVPTGRKDPYNVKSDEEYDQPTGAGHFALSADMILKKVQYPYSITFATFGYYNFKGEKQFFPDEDPIKFKRANHMGVRCSMGIHLNDWIVLTNEIGFFAHGKSKYYYEEVETGDNGWAFKYIPNIYFQIRRIRLKEHIILPLWGKNDGADPTYAIYMQYIF